MGRATVFFFDPALGKHVLFFWLQHWKTTNFLEVAVQATFWRRRWQICVITHYCPLHVVRFVAAQRDVNPIKIALTGFQEPLPQIRYEKVNPATDAHKGQRNTAHVQVRT